jgi:hypothetical protein
MMLDITIYFCRRIVVSIYYSSTAILLRKKHAIQKEEILMRAAEGHGMVFFAVESSFSSKIGSALEYDVDNS